MNWIWRLFAYWLHQQILNQYSSCPRWCRGWRTWMQSANPADRRNPEGKKQRARDRRGISLFQFHPPYSQDQSVCSHGQRSFEKSSPLHKPWGEHSHLMRISCLLGLQQAGGFLTPSSSPVSVVMSAPPSSQPQALRWYSNSMPTANNTPREAADE